MTEFTLLKLQLDDASFAANAPFSGGDSDDADAGPESDEEDESGGVLPVLLGLVFLVAVAAVAKKVLDGRSEPPAVDVTEPES